MKSHFGMEWFRQLPRAAALGALLFTAFLIQCQVHCYHIRLSMKHHICHNDEGDEGVCMFVWECIRFKGKPLGSCADGFLFGSCCAINDTKDTIQSNKSTTQSLSTSTTAKPSNDVIPTVLINQLVYPPVSNPSFENFTQVIKTTRVPIVRPTNSNYGYTFSTKNWFTPSAFRPSTARPPASHTSNSSPSTKHPSNFISTTFSSSTSRPSTARPSTVRPLQVESTTFHPSIVHLFTLRPSTFRPLSEHPSAFHPTTSRPPTSHTTTSSPSNEHPFNFTSTTFSSSTSRPSTKRPSTVRPFPVESPTFHSFTVHPFTLRPSTFRPLPVHPSAFRPSTARPPTSHTSTFNPSTEHTSNFTSTTFSPSTSRPSTLRPSTVRPLTDQQTTLRTSSTVHPFNIRPSAFRPSTIRPSTFNSTTFSPSTSRPSTLHPLVVNLPTFSPSVVRPSPLCPCYCDPLTHQPTTFHPSNVNCPSTFPLTTSPSTLRPPTISLSTLRLPTIRPTTLGLPTTRPTTLRPSNFPPTALRSSTLHLPTTSPPTLRPQTTSPSTLRLPTTSPSTLHQLYNSTTYIPSTSRPSTVRPYTFPCFFTKKPTFATSVPTTSRSTPIYWTSKYPCFRPSWKPSLRPTFGPTSSPRPQLFTYIDDSSARPSFTPFTSKTPYSSTTLISTPINASSSVMKVSLPFYSTTSSTFMKPTVNTIFNETPTPSPDKSSTESNQRPFTFTSNTSNYESNNTEYTWLHAVSHENSSNSSSILISMTQENSSPLPLLFPTTRTQNPLSIVLPTTQAEDFYFNNYSLEERLTTEKPLLTESTTGSTASGISNYSSELPLDLITSTTLKTTPHPISPCGWPIPYPQKKVVGGRNSAFGSWPWQVSVRRTSFFGFSSTHRCGGALIHPQWVATAGHCVDDLLLSQIIIRVGEYDFSSVQEPHGHADFSVKKKVVHPRYNFFTYENDLALVQLEKSIDPVQYPHITPICLPPSDEDLIGRNATVTGWGRLSEGGVLPTVLQEVQVPIISNEKCKTMFLAAGRHEYIPDIFMCAGFEEGGRDSCQGDSGGPLQIQTEEGYWFLAGIISWGIGCAEPNMPGVCTRISKFKDWVVEQVA